MSSVLLDTFMQKKNAWFTVTKISLIILTPTQNDRHSLKKKLRDTTD